MCVCVCDGVCVGGGGGGGGHLQAVQLHLAALNIAAIAAQRRQQCLHGCHRRRGRRPQTGGQVGGVPRMPCAHSALAVVFSACCVEYNRTC